ncbi:MAG: Zn-dependent alcohol dehydrogenase [Xanthobacteraceae bacterium]|jgi:alcohol dehydrogenase/S-(hydroxymethyl)glutathione dehydrogenase/alcohol dehydrogenase
MDSLAAVFRDVGAPMSIEHITLDPPGPTEVLVRIAAVGLCRTDYHVMRGERRVAMRPMVLGHEAAGVVEEIGAEVGEIKRGDHVVLTFIPACGICRWCRQGLHHLCAEGPRITQGPQLDGTYRRRDRQGVAVGAFCMIGAFAECTVVDQASVVVIDSDIPLDLASLVACGVPAGVGAARYRARVKPGESVLVVGCGGDGMNVVQGAQLCGAATIIAADIVPAKLDWAREFGATHGVNAQGEELTRAVLELTDGIGVNHAFVCIDPPATLLPAFRATTKGGNVVVTALTPDSVTEIRIPPLELFVTQKAIMGAVYGFASPRLQIPELLALYRKGALKLRELITQTYRLDEINYGYADLDAGKNLRGIVVFDR